MKKINIILACLLFCLTAKAQSYKSDDIYMSMTTEKESGDWCLSLIPENQAQNVWVDWNGNGEYDNGEEDYWSVHAIDSKTITIYGQIVEMECPFNQLSHLDISHNPNLRVLFCQSNSLTSVDLSNNTKLNILKCNNNPIENLDVSGATHLSILICYSIGISGQEMDDLAASLNDSPLNTPKQFVVFSNLPDENNVCTTEHVAVADKKEWGVMQDIFDESGVFISREHYGGSYGLLSVVEKHTNTMVYPNPTTGIVHVKVHETLIGETLSIVDVTGKCHLSSVMTENEFDLDLSELPRGLYFLNTGTKSVAVIRR